jgi:hypothetical protein
VGLVESKKGPSFPEGNGVLKNSLTPFDLLDSAHPLSKLLFKSFSNEIPERSAMSHVSESAVQQEILAGPLLERCKALRRYLKDSSGVHFEPADLRRAQSLVASSASSSGEGSSSTAVADSNAMAITGGSAHVGDWMKYDECVRTKVCKLKDGQEWTKELLRQRLDVLRRVRWCLCCGEICQVRSDKDANWSDAEIMGDCHRKNTRTTNDGSAYPECNNKTGDNKTGEWKSLKHNRQMMNRRAYEIRKLQRKVAKCVASAAAGQRQKKKLKKRKN